MNLQYYRMKKGKSLVDVADECLITKQRYFGIEKNGITSTSEETARKIAKSLGVNLFEICGDSVLKFKPRNEEEKKALLKSIEEIVF